MVVVVAVYACLVLGGMSLALLLGLKYAALFLAMSCSLSFWWASRRFFRRTGPLNSCQRWVLATMYAAAVLHAATIIYKNHGTIWHFLTALFLYSLSLLVFWSSVIAARRHALSLFFAGSDEPSGLLTSGPYAWVRHPFYTSYTIAWIAGVAATGQEWLLISVGICLAVYAKAAAAEERRFLCSQLAADYLAYARQVGMFWPSFARYFPAPETLAQPVPDAIPGRLTRPIRSAAPVAVVANYAD